MVRPEGSTEDTITPPTPRPPEEYTLADILARVRELTGRTDIETVAVSMFGGSGCTRRLVVAGERVGPTFYDWSSGFTGIGGCSMIQEARDGQPAEDVAQALAEHVSASKNTVTIQEPTIGRVVWVRISQEYNRAYSNDVIVDGLDQDVVPATVMRHYGKGRVQLAPFGYNALFTASHGDQDGMPLMSCWCYPPRTSATIEVDELAVGQVDHQGSVLQVDEYAHPAESTDRG